MQELKPVAWMWRCPQYCTEQGWHVSKKRPADAEPPATESYEDIPLHYIPETHRIVPVELLKSVARMAQWLGHQDIVRLQAIIDKEPTT
jgi:hypothetical protein